MPELPEVQTIVNDLNKKIIKRRITGVWFDTPKLIKRPKPEDLRFKIKDLRISGIKRRGKNILIYLSQKPKVLPCRQAGKSQKFLLLIHQKLTGHLLYGKWNVKREKGKDRIIPLIKGPLEEKVNNYIHLIFYLDNGWQLALSDLRKFAKVLFGLKEEIENSPDLKSLGPEPLDKSFNFSIFQSAILKNKGKIKQVLMDQEVIAGIGNIYSDEILWQAKIHPLRRVNELTVNELKGLYSAMRKILTKAVRLRGTSTSDYRDTTGKPGAYAKIRKAYQREGEPCPRCKTLIKRIKIGGRSAHYCPACQRLKP